MTAASAAILSLSIMVVVVMCLLNLCMYSRVKFLSNDVGKKTRVVKQLVDDSQSSLGPQYSATLEDGLGEVSARRIYESNDGLLEQ